MSALGLLIDPDCVLCKDHDFPLAPLSRHVALDVSVTDLSRICIHVCISTFILKKNNLLVQMSCCTPCGLQAFLPSTCGRACKQGLSSRLRHSCRVCEVDLHHVVFPYVASTSPAWCFGKYGNIHRFLLCCHWNLGCSKNKDPPVLPISVFV